MGTSGRRPLSTTGGGRVGDVSRPVTRMTRRVTTHEALGVAHGIPGRGAGRQGVVHEVHDLAGDVVPHVPLGGEHLPHAGAQELTGDPDATFPAAGFGAA